MIIDARFMIYIYICGQIHHNEQYKQHVGKRIDD